MGGTGASSKLCVLGRLSERMKLDHYKHPSMMSFRKPSERDYLKGLSMFDSEWYITSFQQPNQSSSSFFTSPINQIISICRSPRCPGIPRKNLSLNVLEFQACLRNSVFFKFFHAKWRKVTFNQGEIRILRLILRIEHYCCLEMSWNFFNFPVLEFFISNWEAWNSSHSHSHSPDAARWV